MHCDFALDDTARDNAEALKDALDTVALTTDDADEDQRAVRGRRAIESNPQLAERFDIDVDEIHELLASLESIES
jgi:phytoene/squalene synthetase